jgi:hypothetical protein
MRTLLVISLLACMTSLAEAVPALSIISGEADARAVRDSTHGWKFRANAPVVVTHLGLFDHNNDGLQRDYPIGIYDFDDELLLTSGTMHAGVGDTLIDRFRYVDTPDITLTVGEEYVIAWYTPDVIVPDSSDYHFSDDGEFAFAPEITRTANSLFRGSTGGLVFPIFSDGDDNRIGTNFLFRVPEPSAVTLLGPLMLALLGLTRRR